MDNNMKTGINNVDVRIGVGDTVAAFPAETVAQVRLRII